MKNLRHYLPGKSIKRNALASLVTGLLLFLTLSLSSLFDFVTNSLISIGYSVFIFIVFNFEGVYGQKRHSKIIESNGFKELILKGFSLEEKKSYKGLNGVFEGYIIDVYYDWDTFVRAKSFKAVVFNVYFKKPTLLNGDFNKKRIKELEAKYFISEWKFKSYNYFWRENMIIMRNGVSIINPSTKTLIERMNLVVNILKSESIEPLDRKTLNELRTENPKSCAPEIEIYHGA